jgi:deoxyribose-phosphate aldolase
MDAAFSPASVSQSMEALRSRVEPAVLAVGGPTERLITLAEARPVDPNVLPIDRLVDHTLLKPEATPGQIEQLCDEALEFQFAAVCVHSGFVGRVAARLSGSDIAPCSAVGFPFGTNLTSVKVYEARQAIAAGAREVDMVLPIGLLKAGEYDRVAEDLVDVTRAAHAQGALVKLILETALLSDEEKVAACMLAAGTGVDLVKTSTGFAGGGATEADVALMRQVVGDRLGVKAAGGIRTLDDARRMVAAGATRLGTSAGVNIARQAQGQSATGSPAGY